MQAARRVARRVGLVPKHSICLTDKFPTHHIGKQMRFPPEVVERLRAIQWWNWSPERVKRAVPYLQNSNIEESFVW